MSDSATTTGSVVVAQVVVALAAEMLSHTIYCWIWYYCYPVRMYSIRTGVVDIAL